MYIYIFMYIYKYVRYNIQIQKCKICYCSIIFNILNVTIYIYISCRKYIQCIFKDIYNLQDMLYIYV
jgi:hypothetical protein